MQKFLDQIRRTIDGNRLLDAGDSVLVAVSGGADSVVLLDLLVQLRKPYALELKVAHLDHGLRGEASDADRRFVEQLADSLGLPCHSAHRDVALFRQEQKLSLEEAARQVRYDFLFSTAEQHAYRRIATAHHASDNAELVLMNLMRGSGPTGLAGMDATGFNGRLIRPLLDVSRADIIGYLNHQGLDFRDDSTNLDRLFLRNRVRLDLLPHIEEHYQPGFSRTLTRTARIIQDDEVWMDELIEPLFEDLVTHRSDDRLTLNLPRLARLHVAAQRRIVRRAIGQIKGDLRGMGLVHLESVLRLIGLSESRKSLDLPGRIRVFRLGVDLVVKQERQPLRQSSPFGDKKTGKKH